MAATFGPQPQGVCGDPGVHDLSVAYFENLRNSPVAHRLSMEMLTARVPLDDRAKTVCLEIIADYIRTSYEEDATPGERAEVRTFLTRYADVHLPDGRVVRQDDPQVVSLAAEIFGLVGLVDYPLHWPDFYDRLASIAGFGSRGVSHFLLTLRVISHTVAGQPISEEVFNKNLVYVKALEANDFETILDTWYWLLIAGDESVKKKCMNVMCEFMTMIDPEYFSRHHLMTQVLEEMENVNVQKTALTCFFELISRMDMENVEHRDYVVLVFQELISRDLARPDHVNESFSTRIGILLAVIGSHLLKVSDVDNKNECVGDAEGNTKYYSCLNVFLPHILNFLESRTINISSSVIPFFLNYVAFLKHRNKLNLEEYNTFIKLLGIVMVRIKMRPTYVYAEDYVDMTRDAFIKYRITLMNLFDNLATVKRKVVFNGISQLILKNLVKKDWKQEPFNVAEYPVFLIHFLSKSYWQNDWESHGTKPSKTLLMRALLDSDIVSHPHPAVTEQFFKAVGSNVNFFLDEPKYIPTTLSAFLKRGLRHSSLRVQHTCADQLLKLVKDLTAYLSDSFLDIITSIKDAVIIPASFQDGPRTSVLRPGTRLSLFEIYGIAICLGKLHKQNKRHFLAEILVPTMHMYHDSCNEWTTTRDQDGCAELICRAMEVVTRVARPFDAAAARESGCDDVFIDTITILDHCPLSQLVRADINLATTGLIHQMVICLEEKFIPFLPKMFQGMFGCKSRENVIRITQTLISIINKHKRKMFSYFRCNFVRICNHIYDSFTHLAKLNDAGGQQRTLDDRQEFFLFFLKALADHSMLFEIFVAQEEKIVAKLVAMIASSALEGSRGRWRARGFAIFAHIVDKWAKPRENHSAPLVKFVYDYMVKASFVAMHDAVENLDASFLNYMDVFTECASLLDKMYQRRGREMVTWLIQDYLPQLGVSANLAEEMTLVVMGDLTISLEDYLKCFFIEAEDIHIPPLYPFNPVAISHHHPLVHSISYYNLP